jgi:hypothetical protein
MARVPKTQAPEPPFAMPEKARASRVTKESTSTALIPWEEEMKAAAIAAAEAEKNTGGGQFFSLQSGQLALGGTQMKNNRMAVIILDSMFENIFYEGQFDVQNPTPPTCFAFDHAEEDLKPHKVVFELGQEQNPQCKGCPQNVYGTATTGKGKACRNTRRIALIPAGDLDDQDAFTAERDPVAYTKSGIALLKIPVTSVNGYGSFVKGVANTMGRPPHGIFTRVRVVPDPKTQFKVIFEAIGKIPEGVYKAIAPRLKEARDMNLMPYDMTPPVPKPAAPIRRAPAVRKAAKF